MITYLYWIAAVVIAAFTFWVINTYVKKPMVAAITAALLLVIASAAYFFHYQQIFVKEWGGVMTISTPDGQQHMGITWKDEHLWVESYNPADNTCEYREHARGNLLEGKIVIKNCNPLNHP
jgi:hypothetical protein